MEIASDTRNLVLKHFKQLEEQFPNLELNEIEDGSFIISGNLNFKVSHKENSIEDDYDIEIEIPDDYPQNPPSVKETGKKIPRIIDNHVNPNNGTLCLGAPLAIKMTFAKERNLIWFVREQVVRFLFSHSYRQKYGSLPYGELSHGPQGRLEYYIELFSVQNELYILSFLKILADDNYRGHCVCPCGSKQKLRDCHGELLQKIKDSQSADEFMLEYQEIFIYLKKKYPQQTLLEYIPKKIQKKIRKKSKSFFKNRK